MSASTGCTCLLLLRFYKTSVYICCCYLTCNSSPLFHSYSSLCLMIVASVRCFYLTYRCLCIFYSSKLQTLDCTLWVFVCVQVTMLLDFAGWPFFLVLLRHFNSPLSYPAVDSAIATACFCYH